MHSDSSAQQPKISNVMNSVQGNDIARFYEMGNFMYCIHISNECTRKSLFCYIEGVV